MINKVYKTSNLIPKLLIAVTSIFCISSCGKVKNEPVKVIQTGSFSNALVKIEADRNAEYLPIKNLMKCLQDAGYTQPYNLTTKP